MSLLSSPVVTATTTTNGQRLVTMRGKKHYGLLNSCMEARFNIPPLVMWLGYQGVGNFFLDSFWEGVGAIGADRASEAWTLVYYSSNSQNPKSHFNSFRLYFECGNILMSLFLFCFVSCCNCPIVKFRLLSLEARGVVRVVLGRVHK